MFLLFMLIFSWMVKEFIIMSAPLLLPTLPTAYETQLYLRAKQ